MLLENSSQEKLTNSSHDVTDGKNLNKHLFSDDFVKPKRSIKNSKILLSHTRPPIKTDNRFIVLSEENHVKTVSDITDNDSDLQ